MLPQVLDWGDVCTSTARPSWQWRSKLLLCTLTQSHLFENVSGISMVLKSPADCLHQHVDLIVFCLNSLAEGFDPLVQGKWHPCTKGLPFLKHSCLLCWDKSTLETSARGLNRGGGVPLAARGRLTHRSIGVSLCCYNGSFMLYFLIQEFAFLHKMSSEENLVCKVSSVTLLEI